MTLPLPLLYAIVPVLIAGAITFTAWVVRQLTRHAELLSGTATELTSHSQRIGRLEVFQDGVATGRALERAKQLGEP